MHALDKSPSFMSGSTGFELRDKINGYVVDAKAFAFMSILFTDFNLDFYLEVQNLKYLVRTMGDSPFNRRYRCGAVFLPQTDFAVIRPALTSCFCTVHSAHSLSKCLYVQAHNECGSAPGAVALTKPPHHAAIECTLPVLFATPAGS